MFNWLLDSWRNVANLRIHRGGVCAVTLNSEVYAIGGNDGVQSKACCEKYSPLLDRWEDIPLMQQRRAGAGATVANGKERVTNIHYQNRITLLRKFF